jgi:hypothetical protein
MVAESLFCIILSDITPRQHLYVEVQISRANQLTTLDRANSFFFANAFGSGTNVVGPIISASLMQKNIWYPIWLGLALQAVSVVAAFALPETLIAIGSSKGGRVAAPATDSQHPSSTDVLPPLTKTSNKINAELIASVKALAIIFGDWRMAVLAGLYPVRMMYTAVENLLPRYISYRYHWSFASATYLLSLGALGSTMCLFLLLPMVSEQLEKIFDLSAVQKNVVLARLSMGIAGLGLLLQGLAPTIPTLICGLLIGTLGVGGGSALRALAGSLIDHKDNGKVFTGLAVAETISMMAAFPAVAGLYNAGIEKGGGAWLGIPFDFTVLIVGLATVLMCLLKFETSPGS